jgi:single-stranded-DNA-specific exonuclease
VAADLGFSIGPRLNAAGRLDDMSVGINCLLADTTSTGERLAMQLDSLNKSRRRLQEKMQTDAEQLIAGTDWQTADAERSNALCLYDDSWHAGVVGLVATRIREQVNRPVIAFAGGADDGSLKGSGRSVTGIHMRDLLANIDAANPGLIARFGGHAMAAGLSIARESLDAFRAAFESEVDRYAHQIDDSDTLHTDGELNPADFGLGLAEALRGAGPWGQGFPEPLFEGTFALRGQRIVGERHLKLQLQPAAGATAIDAIAFNHPELLTVDGAGKCFAVFRLDVNEFRGVRSPQLVVEHIECV